MTGPQHWAKAEEHLAAAAAIETDGHDDSMSAWHQRQAQAHATLALVASIADPLSYGDRSDSDWKQVFR
jgi:hypothetical protein